MKGDDFVLSCIVPVGVTKLWLLDLVLVLYNVHANFGQVVREDFKDYNFYNLSRFELKFGTMQSALFYMWVSPRRLMGTLFVPLNRFPAVLQHMKQILRDINTTAIPPGNLPWDPKADPQLWDHTWTNFGDYEKTV